MHIACRFTWLKSKVVNLDNPGWKCKSCSPSRTRLPLHRGAFPCSSNVEIDKVYIMGFFSVFLVQSGMLDFFRNWRIFDCSIHSWKKPYNIGNTMLRTNNEVVHLVWNKLDTFFPYFSAHWVTFHWVSSMMQYTHLSFVQVFFSIKRKAWEHF